MGDNYTALNALTGGLAGALDKIDGAGLSDGDAATVVLSTGVYHYHLNATSGASENSPYVISPDSNPGTKRWILVTPQAPFSHVSAKTDAGQLINNNTATTVIFEDEDYDSLGEYDASTGLFTAIHTGYYSVKSRLSYSGAGFTWAINDTIYCRLRLDGSTTILLAYRKIATTGTTEEQVELSVSVYLTATQTLEVQALQVTGSNINLLANALRNYIMIDRIA